MVCAASCSVSPPSAELLIYNGKDPYIESYMKDLQLDALGLFPLTVHDAKNSQVVQNEYLEQAIARGAPLVIVNPVDRLAAYSMIQTLKREDIPVIFFNREPLEDDLYLWERAYYVGARAEQSGQMQADLVMDLFGGRPEDLNKYDRNGDNVIQTILLKGEQGHQDAEARTREGLRSFEIAGFVLEVLALEIANWNRGQAYELMGTLIEDFGDEMELVLSNNDAMALGAINRMRQSGMFKDSNGNGRIDKDDEQWVPVVGIDGLDEAVDQIRSGYMYATVLNDSGTQAKAVVNLAAALIDGSSLSDLKHPLVEGKYIWIDYQPLMLE
jgi:methyl-galactoside transport system substrate-binding protein